MTDRLIIQTCDDWHSLTRYLDYSRPVHQAYADACGADYEVFLGRRDPDQIGLWNRWPMFLDAFDRGYRKIVYMDVDVLVIRPNINIFTETGDTSPLAMAHMGYEHSVFQPWCQYEDGVMVVNNVPDALNLCHWIWEQRNVPPLAHHQPDFFEQNWMQDRIAERPELVAYLDPRFDYVQNSTWAGSADRAVILGFHGMNARLRWAAYRGALALYAGIETTEEDAL